MPEYGPRDDGVPYQIHILQPEKDLAIHAYMPENFTSSISSDYDAPFTESIVNQLTSRLPGAFGGAALAATKVAGFGTTTQALSMQVWQGAAPMDFSIPVQFLYDTDTEEDIIKPMKALMGLALPNQLRGSKGLILESPGPSISEGEGGGSFGGFIENDLLRTKNDILLAIGTFMHFPSVVVTNVDSDWEIKLDRKSHKPIALNATVAFRTFLTPTVDDLDTIFSSGI